MSIIGSSRKVVFIGLTPSGVYRVPGSEPVVRDLLDKFLRGRGVPNLAQYDDINVIASCLKHFLRKLKVKWNSFNVDCIGLPTKWGHRWTTTTHDDFLILLTFTTICRDLSNIEPTCTYVTYIVT